MSKSQFKRLNIQNGRAMMEGIDNDTEEQRKLFERWIMNPPYEHMCDRHSDDHTSSWTGQYKRYETQLAWDAWQESHNNHKRK